MESYHQQLSTEAAREASDRGLFDRTVAGQFVVEQSRGASVFVNFAEFVQEQESQDGKAALFRAYLEQMSAFTAGRRDPTPLVRAFGDCAEDVRCLAKKVYDERRSSI